MQQVFFTFKKRVHHWLRSCSRRVVGNVGLRIQAQRGDLCGGHLGLYIIQWHLGVMYILDLSTQV